MFVKRISRYQETCVETTLKLLSHLDYPYGIVSGLRLRILTKGIVSQPVEGLPCKKSILLFGIKQLYIHIYIFYKRYN